MPATPKTIAIIGAGLGGMSAAWDLVRAGHQVTVFDSLPYPGGLASGFKEPHWDWSVEHYYHHWFTSDRHVLGLIAELGLSDQVVVPKPKTVAYHQGKFYRLDSPLAALTFPGFTFLNMVRFALVTAYLKFIADWRNLEREHADAWMRKAYGAAVYESLFEPLLHGKFGPYMDQVNMAWMWARLKARTTRLATFRGGFQALNDTFAERLRSAGVQIRLSTPVKSLHTTESGSLRLELDEGFEDFDQVLATSSPHQLARLAPELPREYLQGLLDLKSMGAIVMVLSLRHTLSSEGYYWYNLPKSAGYPFLALVEHTNFLSPQYFGGDHIIYCGDYLEQDHEYFNLSDEELLERFLPGIARFNPEFKPEWIRKIWVSRTRYAQPIPLVNHSRNIPAIQTPISGLYFASMSQVYPWDRGTNYAVEIGRKAAKLMLNGA